MGFRQADSEKRGGYAKVWKVEDKGNYSVGQVSTSKKKPGTESEYEVDFQDGFVRFIGSAHEAIQQLQIGDKGLSIQITSCDVTNKYDKASNRTYVNYAIFAIDVVDGNNGGGTAKSTAKKSTAKTKAKAEVEDTTDDDDLPF